MTTYVQAGVSGIMIGGLYAVMALGLSLTWGLLRVINLAHFALILLGAYVTYQLATSTGADPLLAAFILVPSMFVLGVAVHWVIERFQVDEFNSLLLSFGLFIIAIRLIDIVWSADFRQIARDENPYASRALFIGDIAFPMPQLMAFGAALAGVLIGINQAVFPQLAFEWVGLIFAVVILGGIGNLLGAVGAGILIGLVAGLVGVAWTPQGAPLVVFLLLIL